MTTPNPSGSDIIKDEVKQPTAPFTALQGNASRKLPDFSDPVAVQAFVVGLAAENAELLAAEAKRNEELSYKTRIAAAEPRFSQTKNILVLRRCPNPDELAPARTVFDHIEVQDLKRDAKDDLKRITVSEKELMAYQAIKAEGIKSITYKMIEDRLKKAGHNVVDTNETETGLDVEAKK